MTIKKGDKVWWRARTGLLYASNFRTMSGTVEEIEGDIASVYVSTQNVHGIKKKHVNTLNLKK